MKIIPLMENSPLMITKITKGITPISFTLIGILKIPVPIALAMSVKTAPRRDPYFMGLKYLFFKLSFGLGSSSSEI